MIYRVTSRKNNVTDLVNISEKEVTLFTFCFAISILITYLLITIYFLYNKIFTRRSFPFTQVCDTKPFHKTSKIIKKLIASNFMKSIKRPAFVWSIIIPLFGQTIHLLS